MKKVGYTYKLIPSDADFVKFAVKYGPSGKSELIDLENFEISKVTFRETMGLLAAVMGYAYWIKSYIFVVLSYIDLSKRLDEELAMVYGLLTLALFLMNSFGFWGIICLPVSPPIVLLGHQFANRFWFENGKESQA